MFTTQQSISLDRETKQRARKFRASLYSKLLSTGANESAALLAAEAIAAREVLGTAFGYNQGISLLQADGIDLSEIELLAGQVWQELESAESTEVAATSPQSERSTFLESAQQELKGILEGLEEARAKRIASGNALHALNRAFEMEVDE